MLKLIKKIFYILPKGDPYKVAVLFGLMMVAAGLEVLGIGMIPLFVSIVASPESVLSYEPLKGAFNFLGIQTDRDLLIWGSFALLAVFLVKSVYIVIFNYFEARFVFNRNFTVSNDLMTSYMQAPYTFHLQRNTAELLRNITQEVKIVVQNIFINLLQLCREGLMTFSILLFLLIMEPLITLMVIFFSGAGAGTFFVLTQNKLKEFGRQEQEHRRNMIKAVNQGLGGIKDARVLNREKEFINAFRQEAYNSSRLQAFNRYVQQIPKPVVETTAVFTMMLIAGLMVWQERSMSAIIPILTLFAMATVRLMPSVHQISGLLSMLKYNLVAINPIFDDLKELEDSGRKFKADRKKDDKVKFERDISAEKLSYRYPKSDEQALKDVSFKIKKGQAVAFVGESGAGKSTIVDLILGLMEPEEGEICVDGMNIQSSLSGWQKNIGYIPQSIYLADETIKSNVAFGVPEKDIDDSKVWEALELAQLKDMVSNFPLGLETEIGENGTRISGGQRQRVGIARALYHDPQVLVMDEATSALDNVTEKEITKAIERLQGERTIIMIAHRLTTVMNCNKLYLMEEGRIIEEGSYSELINSNRLFREMAMEK